MIEAPKRFGDNPSEATEVKKNGTERLGMDQDGVAKKIDAEILLTKENVGLWNVPNVTTNNQAPTYTIAEELAELTSGEVLSTAFGKLAKEMQVVIAQLDGKSAYRGTLLESGYDLNSITKTGTYTAPAGSEINYIVHINSDSTATNAVQIAIGATTSRIYLRNKIDNTWSAWSTGVTPTEIGYLKSVTSNIQTQLNALGTDKQNISEKTIAWSEEPNDQRYPTEKLVKDSLDEQAEAISGHIEDTENPHEVTKTQVGLGSVDNTSDSAKPVSTLQQQAFDLKLDKSDVVDNLTTDDASKALSAKQGKTLSEQLSILDERVMFIEHRSKLTTWAEVQDAAKNGLASRYLKVGDLVETSYGGSPAVVELIGINHPFDIPPVGVEYGDVLSWGFKDCLQNAQYSAPQALFNAVEGLSAGTYTFVNSYDSLPYTFTLNEAIPVGGVIVITSWGAGTYEPTVLKTMQADRLTDVETGVAVTQASGGTALAPVNFTPRCRYGANLYIESGIRHFLNDDSDSYLWMAQGLYDMPSTYGAGGGFLKRLDADFASVIGPVVKRVARATADGGGQDTFEDKVWLLSRVEMGYGTEGVTTGEQVYERWNGATNAERIKLLSGSPRYWWLRPPSVSYQYGARFVSTDGALYDSGSYVSFGLAPGLAVY